MRDFFKAEKDKEEKSNLFVVISQTTLKLYLKVNMLLFPLSIHFHFMSLYFDEVTNINEVLYANL